MAADRPKRSSALRRVKPSPAYYVGYVEDTETPEMIMRKFEELERVVAAAQHEQQPTDPTTEDGWGKQAAAAATSSSGQVQQATLPQPLQGTAHGDVEPMPATEDTLDEPLLVQIFKQTSNLNVQAAVGSTARLAGHASTGSLHYLIGDREATPLSGDLSDDEGLDYLRGFWSDEDVLAAGQKVAKRSKRSRSASAGKRGGSSSSAAGGVASNRERDSSNMLKGLGMTTRERNIRLQVVMQYNRDAHAFIRRRMRADSSEGITQLRIPGPPLPTAWGRTIQPYNPALPLPFALASVEQAADNAGVHAVQETPCKAEATIAPPLPLLTPQSPPPPATAPASAAAGAPLRSSQHAQQHAKVVDAHNDTSSKQQQQDMGASGFVLAPPPPSTHQWTPMREMLLSQLQQVQQLMQDQQQHDQHHTSGTNMQGTFLSRQASALASAPTPQACSTVQQTELAMLDAPMDLYADDGDHVPVRRTRRRQQQHHMQQERQPVVHAMQHTDSSKQAAHSAKVHCQADPAKAWDAPEQPADIILAPPPPPLRGSNQVIKAPFSAQHNNGPWVASSIAAEGQPQDVDICMEVVGSGLSDLAGAGGYIEVPDMTTCDMMQLLSGYKFNVVLINTGWEVQLEDDHALADVRLGFNQEDALLVSRLCRVPVPLLCPTGFVFVWVQKPHLQAVFKQLYAWGYTYVENLTWVWLHANNSVLRCPSTYCATSHLTLAMFRKEGEGKDIQLRHQRNADVMLDCVRTLPATSSPPAELYSILETMLPGEVAAGRCLELCWTPPVAGAAGVRPGWLQLVQQGAASQYAQ